MNILSIKGGGSRGLIATRFLLEIEKITGVPIAKLFDYVGGSSVGTLIACGLFISDDGINPLYSAEEIYKVFLDEIPNAFTWTYGSWISSGFGLLGPSYTHNGLHKIVMKKFKDKKLGNLLKPVIFPAYDKNSCKAYYFDEKDKDVLISDVIMACTSAPTYFPSYMLTINGKQYDMIDSGCVINNTAELVYLKATENIICVDKSKILELCVGTGLFNYTYGKGGLLSWAPIIVDIFMNGSSYNELYELSLSLPKENYFIMDVMLDYKYDYMDNINKKIIDYYLTETEKWISENKDKINKFCEHLKKNKNL